MEEQTVQAKLEVEYQQQKLIRGVEKLARSNPNSGICVRPPGHSMLKVTTYPVRKISKTTLKIGFESIDAKLLTDKQF